MISYHVSQTEEKHNVPIRWFERMTEIYITHFIVLINRFEMWASKITIFFFAILYIKILNIVNQNLFTIVYHLGWHCRSKYLLFQILLFNLNWVCPRYNCIMQAKITDIGTDKFVFRIGIYFGNVVKTVTSIVDSLWLMALLLYH